MAEGITICIAAYRYDARPLLDSLSPSLAHSQASVRILLGDDASGQPWIGEYDLIPSSFPVRIVRPSHNLGRVGIRNLLAATVDTEWLLFLDVDSQIPDANFLIRYVQASNEADAIAGGTLYTPDQPSAGSLRHRYGLARELTTATNRNRHPYARLALNNLLIRKTVFLAAGSLDASITGYGHEDTVLGISLKRIGARILHIDNPVLHTGLEDEAVFITKSEEAARGLARLYKGGKLGREDARLIAVAERLKSWHIGWLPQLATAFFPRSSLYGLDIRKLSAFLNEL